MGFSVAKKYNTQKVFEVNTEDFDYKSLEELYLDEETVYIVRGLYINNKGNFGPKPVLATEDYYVNIPSHLVDNIREMIEDRTTVKAINDGCVGFTIYKYYQKRYNKDCYSIKWVDVVIDC